MYLQLLVVKIEILIVLNITPDVGLCELDPTVLGMSSKLALLLPDHKGTLN